MEGCYEVYFGREAAGKVQLLRQGLYYRVICRCKIPTDNVCRLYAVMGDKRENIGVLIPDGEGLLLDRKIPAKRFSDTVVQFAVSSGAGSKEGKFVPICPEEPFLYIDRLKNAFLASEHGKIGIRTEEHPEAV